MAMQTFPWWDHLGIQACWGARAEDAQSCASRLARMLESLEPLHPLFGELMWVGGPLRPLFPLPPVSELAGLFAPSRIYDKAAKRRFYDGFRFSADSRLDNGRSLRVNMNVGETIPRDCRSNDVYVWTVVHDVDGTDRATIDAIKAGFVEILRAWHPEYATLSSTKFGDSRRGFPRTGRFCAGDWTIYLAPPLAAKVALPDVAIVDEAAGGILIRASEDVYQPADPAVSAAIRAALVAAGQ